ncbi:MAG: motif [Bacteroidota bacterium]|jgi:hypothetical protein
MEIWKDIEQVSQEFDYQVSNLGNVRSMNYNRTGKAQVLKVRLSPSNARLVLLAGRRIRSIAQLVLLAFDGPRPSELHFSHHKDGDVQNDCIENLEWQHIKIQNGINGKKGYRYPKGHPYYQPFLKNTGANNEKAVSNVES